MRSWTYLTHLIPFWGMLESNPVAEQESLRPPLWAGMAGLPVRGAVTVLIVFIGVQALGILVAPLTLQGVCLTSTLCFLAPLLLGPSLLLWAVPLGLVLGPSIVRERERRTWDTLRVTPLTLESILYGKAQGALWVLRQPLDTMQALLVIVSMGISLVSLGVLYEGEFAPGRSNADIVLWALLIIAAMLLGVVYILDRAQQFVLMAAGALWVSSTARSSRAALVAAVSSTLLLWLLDVAAGWLILTLHPAALNEFPGIRLIALIALGPLGGYVIDLPLTTTFAIAGGTLLVREGLLRLIWRGTLLAARQI